MLYITKSKLKLFLKKYTYIKCAEPFEKINIFYPILSSFYRFAHSTSTLLAKIRGAISEAIVAARSNLSSRREHKVLQPVDKI